VKFLQDLATLVSSKTLTKPKSKSDDGAETLGFRAWCLPIF
jgi:hypothetical protein